MVKIETIKKDLEEYFRNKDGKEISLYVRPLDEIRSDKIYKGIRHADCRSGFISSSRMGNNTNARETNEANVAAGGGKMA